ncbi:unnamed protein product [Chrysoparadoxa australica]
MGDAVYAEHPGELPQVKEAYDDQLKNKDYAKFINSGIEMLGVYDDHDFGVNDSGSHLPFVNERKEAFLRFLGVPETDERWEKGRGLYMSQTYGSKGKQIKVIMLDLRTHRDRFPVLNVGQAHLMVLRRAIWGQLCLGTEFGGDMLGEAQWQWLENELKDSEAAGHIIVSSIQVFTSNPLLESWGHFPRSKARLLDMLDEYKPRGLTFLSGDVHLAELLTGVDSADTREKCSVPQKGKMDAGEEILEVTSSGLTHSCATAYGIHACQGVFNSFPRHRAQSHHYLYENFGTVDIDWAGEEEGDTDSCVFCPGTHICEGTLSYAVRQMQDSEPVLQVTKSTCQVFTAPDKDCLVEPLEGNCTEHRAFTIIGMIVMLLGLRYLVKRSRFERKVE